MRKRIWAVLLSVCLLVGLLPTTALAGGFGVTTYQELVDALSGTSSGTIYLAPAAEFGWPAEATLTIPANVGIQVETGNAWEVPSGITVNFAQNCHGIQCDELTINGTMHMAYSSQDAVLRGCDKVIIGPTCTFSCANDNPEYPTVYGAYIPASSTWEVLKGGTLNPSVRLDGTLTGEGTVSGQVEVSGGFSGTSANATLSGDLTLTGGLVVGREYSDAYADRLTVPADSHIKINRWTTISHATVYLNGVMEWEKGEYSANSTIAAGGKIVMDGGKLIFNTPCQLMQTVFEWEDGEVMTYEKVRDNITEPLIDGTGVIRFNDQVSEAGQEHGQIMGCNADLVARTAQQVKAGNYDVENANALTWEPYYAIDLVNIAIERSWVHTWDTGTVTKEATCTEPGEKTYTCTDEGCGETKTEEIPATGHTYGENGICTACGAEADVLYVNGVNMVNGGEVDGASYDADTNTLTLTNASITGYYADADVGTRAGIYYQSDATLNIKLSGKNTVSISCTSDQIGYGIDSSGPVTITGSGTLDFQTRTDGESTKGYGATAILATDLTVTGGAAVTADLPTVGTYDNLGSIVSLLGGLTVSNDASLTATGKYEAVKTSGDVNIATGGSLTAKAITAVNAGGSVTVENGSFTADAVGTSANMGYAVKFAGNMTISGDSTVLVNQSADASYAYGLYNTAACNLTISGGTVKIANGSNGTHQAIRLQNSASTFTMTGGDVTVSGDTGLYYGLYNAGTTDISGGVLRHTGDLSIGKLTTLSGEANVTVNGAAYLCGLTMQDSAVLDVTNSTGTAVTSYGAVQVTGGTLTASSTAGNYDALNLTGGDLTVAGGTVNLTGGRYGLYLSNTNGSNLVYESGVLSASGSNGAVVWFSWDTDFSANSPVSIAAGTPITPAGAKLLTATMDGAYAAAYVTADTETLTYEGTTVTNAVKSITFGVEPCENHDWGDWVETQAPTCTKTGVKKHTCSVCGETETQDIDALGHDYEAVVTAPTCTEKGYTTHTCSRCGDSYVDTYINALGHTWGEWTVTTPATCTEAGVEKRTCSACGETEPRDITALGHDYKAVVTAPTCTEQGYTTHTCSRCGDSYVDTYTDALGHDYKAVVTAPTCTEQGYTTHTCSRCGDSYVDTYVNAKGHDWDDGVITTPPTLDAEGVKTFTCQRCGETRTEPVPKLEKQTIWLPGTSFQKTYGDGDFYNTATNLTTGGGALTYASSNTAVARVDAQSGKVTIVGAGDAVITVTAAAVANQYAETSATYAVTVAKAALTITANNKAITYGEKAANSGYAITGFMKGEDESVLSGEAVYSYTYKQYGDVGEYAIDLSGLTSQNYEITFVDGKLTVGKATNYTITLSDLEQLAGHVSGVTARIDPYDTSAVLSVEYEVGGQWTTEAPQAAGTYQVRVSLTASDNIVMPTSAAYTTGTLTVKPGVTVDTGNGPENVDVAVEVSGGTAEITVTGDDLTQIAANADGQVSIDLGSVSDVDTLVLPSDLVGELSKSDKAESLTVSTENASVTLSAPVLDTVATTVTGGEDTISVRLESVAENELNPAQQAALAAITTEYPVAVVDVSLVVTHPDGSTDTLHELGGDVTVTVPYEQLPGLLDGQYVVACYISDDGTVTYLFAQADETNRTITFTTNHFSNYAVFVSGKPASSVTVDGGSGSGIYLAGDTVTIKADSRSGYTFAGWEVVSGDIALTDSKAAEITFIMPTTNVELKATYTKNSSGGGGGGVSTYTLTFDTNGGSKIASVSKAGGATISLVGYVPTRAGYDFDGWYSDAKLTDKITSVKLTKNMTVYAKWTEKGGENPFADVAEDAYYADAVIWAVGEGITSGTTATTFTPNAPCTRAQAVTFLWRAAGSPVVNYAMNFSDVSADAYYAEAVRWAVSQGITKGTSDTTFSPNATCTRAQIVTFLWRSQKSPVAGTVNPFTDVADDAYYANAVLWAAENGITGGTTATTFSPNNDCTRAQIVTFLYRAFAD